MFRLDKRIEESSYLMAEWPLSQLVLSKNAAFPWFILIPRVNNAIELIDLTVDQQYLFLKESNSLSYWMKSYFLPIKLNVAAIGNIVPQLHIHHIARFEIDDAWPQPVWGHSAYKNYTEKDLSEIKRQVQNIEVV